MSGFKLAKCELVFLNVLGLCEKNGTFCEKNVTKITMNMCSYVFIQANFSIFGDGKVNRPGLFITVNVIAQAI